MFSVLKQFRVYTVANCTKCKNIWNILEEKRRKTNKIHLLNCNDNLIRIFLDFVTSHIVLKTI